MKKIIHALLIFWMFVVLLTQTSFAASPTPKTASPSADLNRIQKIKDLVASRVAELKLVDRRGLLGSVTEVSTTQLVLQDVQKTRRMVDIDDITKFVDEDNKSFGISDVKKGDNLSIIGLYNKDTKRLLARFVYTVTPTPVFFEGVVTEKDVKNFQLTAVNSQGTKRIIDVTTATKTFSFDEEDGQVKSGFSKVEVGQRVFASGFMDKKVDNQLDSARVIYFPGLALSTGMKKYMSEVTPEETSPTPTTRATRPTVTPGE